MRRLRTSSTFMLVLGLFLIVVGLRGPVGTLLYGGPIPPRYWLMVGLGISLVALDQFLERRRTR